MTKRVPPKSLAVALVAQRLVRGDGQGRAALELARALVEDGNRLTVYAREVDDELAGRVEFKRLRTPPGPQIVDDLDLLVRATFALWRHRPDLTVVIGHTALAPKPFVYNAHFSHQAWRRTWRHDCRPSLRHRVHAALCVPLELLVARRADAVLGPSTTTVEAIVSPRARRRGVVPNGVDLPDDRPVDRPAARAALGIPPEALSIGFVGEFYTGRKGLDILLEAVTASREDDHLVIAGRGDRRWLDRQIVQLGLEGRVHALGFVEPGVVYNACDLVAVPSRFEPFSLVALEAAANGVPVVVAAVAGVSEYLHGAAVIVDDLSAAGLRSAIDVLRDPQRRSELGTRGREAASGLAWRTSGHKASRFVLETINRV